jgi:AcrR family transcriptional regulator
MKQRLSSASRAGEEPVRAARASEGPFLPGRVPERRPGPEGGTRARNRLAQTRAICEAALALFLEQGIEATSVDQIVAAARVAKGSFYRYFLDKTQLVDALFAPLAQAIGGAFDRSERALAAARTNAELTDAYRKLAVELAAELAAAPAEVRLYLQHCRSPAHGAAVPIRAIARVIDGRAVALTELAQARGLLRRLPAQVTALAVVGAVEQLLVRYLEGESLGVRGVPELTDALVSTILDGLRVRS